MTTPETFMAEARQIAAQCWCDLETQYNEMDVVLAEAIAKRIAVWMDTAAFHFRNEQYYRNLLIQCGESIGPLAYTCDDGSVVPDVLCAKIPELVVKLCNS
jgi:hypothetical protein